MRTWISTYGWTMSKKRVKPMSRVFFFWILLLPLLVVAAEVAEAPSLELLEFLGNWETDEGDWQDPLELMKDLEALDADEKTVKVEDDRDGQ